MKLSVRSEYACLALIELASHYPGGQLCTVGDIARQQRIPRKFLEQLLLRLRTAGYVHSHRGKHGGYRLARPPRRICVAEVIRLMDGALAPVESASTYFYQHTPLERSRKLLAVMRRIRNYIAQTLERLTFADLL
jgi:Rrf2 family transcriptional regulator, cysteine metabolism repressor